MAHDNERSKLSKEITVEIPGFKKKKFRSANSILKWLEDEKDAWQKIKPDMDSNNPFSNNHRFDDLISRANQIAGFARQYLDASNESDIRNAENQLRSSIEIYSRGDWLAAESPDGQTVISLAQSKEYTAAWIALVKFRHQKVIFSSIPDMVDFMSGWEIFYNNSINAEAAVNAQKTSLINLKNDWETNYENLQIEIRDNLHNFQRWIRRYKRISLGQNQKYKELQAEHKDRMADMKRAFSTEMKLKSAEKFWRRKRSLNRIREKAAFNKLVGSALFGSIVLCFIYWILFETIGLELKFNVTHTLAYGVPTLLFIWLLKIFASDYRLNQSQADDAEEREAMVFTFKALEFEGRVGDEERLVILNALFRPHSGSSEDSLPLPAWEAIIGRLNKP